MHVLLGILEFLAAINLSAVAFFAFRYFSATVPPPSVPMQEEQTLHMPAAPARLKVVAIR